MSCAVKICKNVKRFRPQGVSFHRFPRDDSFSKWLKVLGMNTKTIWTKNRLICSKHFTDNDFIKMGDNRTLSRFAIPSQLLHSEGNESVIDTGSVLSVKEESVPVPLESPKETIKDDCDSYGSAEFIQKIHNYSLPLDKISSSERRKLIAFIQKIHSYSVLSQGRRTRKTSQSSLT